MGLTAILLAGGLGSRLAPYTDLWPKCLMPISGRPLLEYWLEILRGCSFEPVIVNMHHHGDLVADFLNRQCYRNWVVGAYENELLGTAGTVRAHSDKLMNKTVLLVHADNWSLFDMLDFCNFHEYRRPVGTVMTMMTFVTDQPHMSGIVDTDEHGVVISFKEKDRTETGSRANAAVYLFGEEIINFIKLNPDVTDFSTQVIPNFLGKIATWHHSGIHKDIGTIDNLRKAQNDVAPLLPFVEDEWSNAFRTNSILNLINNR